MTYIVPCLLLWLVAGLAAGEMLIHEALNLIDNTDCSSNCAAIFICITLCGLIALPWLIWRALDHFFTDTIRR